MYLKKLELSGFKSFAKTTVLEFPSRITAIVGPNGSGKSNITEGIRWVLGEQSMKSLRGKKGEDLIWNGSPQAPRMGKASVTLYFDNANGKVPVDFEEVVLSRKIFRDGLNEYYVNDAQVRLKDVVELMAHAGLGEAKHNIISQGEVDRMLLSSARDRREMFEEALGLRVYQIKKRETERKLEATEANIKQVEALIREIAPHLKFLKSQAEKSKMRGVIESDLRQYEYIYCLKEQEEIALKKKELFGKSGPLQDRKIEIKSNIECLSREREEEEKKIIRKEGDAEVERVIQTFSQKQRELERELGRLEGKLEAERGAGEAVKRGTPPFVPSQEIVRQFTESAKRFLRDMRSLLDEEDRIMVIRSHFDMLADDLEKMIGTIEGKSSVSEKFSPSNDKNGETERMIEVLQKESTKIAAELSALQLAEKENRERIQKTNAHIREIDMMLRANQEEDRDIALGLERFRFDEEQIAVREKSFGEDLAAMSITLTDIEEKNGAFAAASVAISRDDARKKAERMRARLEEVGGIDASVLREYEETDARYLFLIKEVGDLKEAASSLGELSRELDLHIERDFREGFGKIKEEFSHYFQVIFGGGRALLDLVSSGIDDEESAESGVGEEGIEISVDLPRKRIQGLAMLSGGERALTAIALLFAITAVNPPPFLILDETDAALDEANSQRYSAILKELAKKTQLLLVTHNRETMKCAGILYGITMGEDGVSKFLSLKFEEAEAYTNR
ncbi:MAG: AAA family ATPase [Candidatus Sungbacteria bacterium]|nr:AAA family ATPase [Candidatus Sungbacteria bacterium]